MKDRILANRMNARKGGLRTARLYGKEFVEERARTAGQTCLMRYGRDFYRNIRKKKEE
jgi:hypothetical protein